MKPVRQHTIPLALIGIMLVMVVLTNLRTTLYEGTLWGEPLNLTTGDIGEYLRIPLPNPLHFFIHANTWQAIGDAWSNVLATVLLVPAAYGVGVVLNRMVARFGVWKTIAVYVVASVASEIAVIYWFWNVYF